MSDIYEYTNYAQKTNKQPACRVAYTLNNTQPVACTIIGEQPLFYMDYEEAVLDEGDGVFDTSLVDSEFDVSAFMSGGDDFFTEADLDLLKDEIKNLKKQISSYESFSSEFIESDEQRMEKFYENVSQCVTVRDDEFSDVRDIVSLLEQSRLAKSYIDFARDNGVDVAFSAQVEKAEYNRKSKTIFVNPDQEVYDLVLSLSGELRHHWQHGHGALINPLMFHPDQAILINRAQIADISISIVRIAWELQLSGYRDAWERLENSPMADLARSFAREAYLDFRTINNGEAAAAVFEAWFLSERCRSQDKVLIQQMLSDSQDQAFGLADTSKTITPDLIAALGIMPYGKNYLAAHVETIMNDTIFTDVRDRSNANFLWFIKFERSFNETEHALQVSDEQTASDTHQGANIKNTSNGTTENEQATVISFPGNAAGATPPKKAGSKRLQSKREEQSESTNVVYLRRWSAE